MTSITIATHPYPAQFQDFNPQSLPPPHFFSKLNIPTGVKNKTKVAGFAALAR
jgi:hypothetical protein